MKPTEIEVIPLYYDYVLTKNYPVNILVGGRNSGKSFFMEQYAAMKMHQGKNYKLMVIEDVETNIGAGVKDGIEQRISEFGLDTYYTSIKQPAEINHAVTGSGTIFKGYHSDKQQKQVKSLNEVTAAWYEESENITYKQFKALRMQLRGGKPEDRQLFLTLNPINSDSFINQYFFQQQPDKVFERFLDGRPKVFEKHIEVDVDETTQVRIPCIVIVSTHWDNPYLTEEQRADIEEMRLTDPDMYAMLAEGKFIKPAGTYFREFSPGVHVVEPRVIPDHWTKYSAIDYGLDMLAVLWCAVDPQNNVWVYKELHESNLIISEAAERIKEINGTDKIRQTYAPGDLWSRTKDTGKSIEETFRIHGVSLYQSSNKRVQGWLAVKEGLKIIESRDIITGEPVKTAKLRVFDSCPVLIKHVQAIQRDPKDANDCAEQPHEITHICDALRYFCVTRFNGFKAAEQETDPDKWTHDKKVHKTYASGRNANKLASWG